MKKMEEFDEDSTNQCNLKEKKVFFIRENYLKVSH